MYAQEEMREKYVNKKILITGGLGFIGSRLARDLVNLGAKVTIVDSLVPEYGGNFFNIVDIKKDVFVNISDVRDPYAMRHLLRSQQILFNLAGQTSHLDSMRDPMTDLDINAKAQLSLLEACREINRDIKIIFASTRQLYGRPEYLPVDENHPIKPVDVNGIHKFAGEQYHLLYGKVYGFPTTIFRLTNTYGPGMRVRDARQTFLGIWIKKIIQGEPIEVFGDGNQLRDFNYVDDCVAALLIAGIKDSLDGKIYNLGDTEKISLKALAELIIAENSGGKYQLIPFPRDREKIDIGDYYGDISAVVSDLDWKPQTNLRRGLRETLAYYRKNLEHYI